MTETKHELDQPIWAVATDDAKVIATNLTHAEAHAKAQEMQRKVRVTTMAAADRALALYEERYGHQ